MGLRGSGDLGRKGHVGILLRTVAPKKWRREKGEPGRRDQDLMQEPGACGLLGCWTKIQWRDG